MRVLHLDSGKSLRGGQWQVLRLAAGLAEAGVEAVLLSPRGSPCFLEARRRGLDVRPLTAASVFSVSRHVDLVHAHDARSHTLAAAIPGPPLIVSRRVAFPVRPGWLSRWKYARPLHYIGVSDYVGRLLVSAGVPPEKISVVYDGVPLLEPSSRNGAVVAPASDDPRKGTALAQQAARLAAVPLHLVTDLELELLHAAVFLYLTYSEGLGSAVLLAMSAGVPVIASRVGGVPEAVLDGETGLLVENQPDAVAAAIRRLTGDPPLAAAMALRARARVERFFSVNAMISGTLRVYRQALS